MLLMQSNVSVLLDNFLHNKYNYIAGVNKNKIKNIFGGVLVYFEC